MTNLVIGAVVGLLIGLLYCYWNQLQKAYQNRDKISSGLNLINAAQDFWEKV